MGSTASLIIRTDEKEIYRTSATADDLSWFVNNIRLINSPKSHLQRFFREYQHKIDHHVQPEGLGMVLVDYLSHTIANYQDVTTIGAFAGVTVSEDVQYLLDLKNAAGTLSNRLAAYCAEGSDAQDFRCVRLREFYNLGKISQVYNSSSKKNSSLPSSLTTLDRQVRTSPFLRFELNLDPFQVHHFTARTNNGAHKLEHLMHALGIRLGKKDQQVWKSWKKENCKK